MSGFWKGKRVLITGDSGFKGSWLGLMLHDLGAEITGISLPDTPPGSGMNALLGLDYQKIYFDIGRKDLFSVLDVFEHARPEIIIHMAAQPLVGESYQAPIGTFDTNVMGTANLLNAARKHGGVGAILVVTSDKCYDPEWDNGYQFDEDSKLGGHDPYSASKACAEMVAESFRRSWDMPIATARAGNVIGGGDFTKGRLVPDMMEAFGRGERVVLKRPNCIRPWQHVADCLRGYLLLAECLYRAPSVFSGPWNFGPPRHVAETVEEMALRAVASWGGDAGYVVDPSAATFHETKTLTLDPGKAYSGLRWQTAWGPTVAIQKTVAWHKAYLKGEDMLMVTRRQIEENRKDAINAHTRS